MTGARLRRILCHRSVVATLALLVLWGSYSAWASWRGDQKLPPAVLASVPAGRVHLAVTLDFPPEAFHLEYFQSLGRLIEVRGETVYLMDVSRQHARALAREYWVREVKLWPGR